MQGDLASRVVRITGAFLGLALVIVLCLRGRWTPRENAEETELRIVSVAPSVTEMLFALGVEDCVVGVTDRCDYPPAARNLESVGGFGAPNMEKLLALSPDLVIGTSLQRNDMAESLRRSGIRVLRVKTDNFSEMFETLRMIGKEVGKARRADEIVAAMQAKLQAIAEEHQEIPVDRRPRVFVELWNDPITTAGKGSFVDELISRAGGSNVAHDLGSAYPIVNPEKVVEWNPDVIVLGYMNQQRPKEVLANRIGWGEVEAVRTGNIINDISPDYLLRPGPRLIEGVKMLSQRLYNSGVKEDVQESRDR
ncbi:MAG: ABC transporter substrate-binding protein [Pirellulaceae bacterium]